MSITSGVYNYLLLKSAFPLTKKKQIKLKLLNLNQICIYSRDSIFDYPFNFCSFFLFYNENVNYIFNESIN